MLYLLKYTFLVPKYVGKIWCQYGEWGGRGRWGKAPQGGPYCTYQDVHASPWKRRAHRIGKEGVVGYYCKQGASMSCSTSPQLCGSWYLPGFLLRGDSLTLINRASFMVLVTPWGSLSMMKKMSSWMVWPVVLVWSYIGEHVCFRLTQLCY